MISVAWPIVRGVILIDVLGALENPVSRLVCLSKELLRQR